MRPLRVGTRGSALALRQACAVAGLLEREGVAIELVPITTHGDRRQDVPLAAIGGKGVFVREIHEALLSGAIDLAVHSAKDMPAVSPDGLTIAAALPREDPRDALVLPAGRAADGLPPLSRFGTGSPRRIAQLRRLYPTARFDAIRGNVDTRIRKLDAGETDALVLACAGLRRLGLSARISRPLTIDECVPAPGQGIIAVETRRADAEVMRRVAAIADRAAMIALAAEQAVVAELGGGCQLPLGVHAEIAGDRLVVRAVAASPGGATPIESRVTGDPGDPVEAGTRLARALASRGARELLQS